MQAAHQDALASAEERALEAAAAHAAAVAAMEEAHAEAVRCMEETALHPPTTTTPKPPYTQNSITSDLNPLL